MRRKPEYLLIGIVAAIAGCSARADEERQTADVPGELRVRLDKDAVQAFMAPERQVHVTGLAKVAVAPDMAEVWVGVNTSMRTAQEAVAANNFAMTDLIEAIKKRGVAPKDIRTSRVSITPQYSQQAVEAKPGLPPVMAEPKVVGYEVSNMVQVTTRDLSKIGELLDAALKAGSNQLQGIYFRIEDREAVVATLRTKAFDDAKAKAEVYAKQSGMTLGPVAQITEADSSWMPAPGAPGPMMMAAPAAPGPSMPVNPGEQEVSVSVSVSYELKPTK